MPNFKKATNLFSKLRQQRGKGLSLSLGRNPHPAAVAAETAPKPLRATEDGLVGRFSKFLFEKVGTDMNYVHAKNIRRIPHPAAVPAETAPKPPQAA